MTLPFLRQRRPADPETLVVLIEDKPVAVALRRHVRARRLKLTLDTTGGRFVLTLPEPVPVDAARRFVQSHTSWMAERMGHFVAPRPFADGACVPLHNQEHRICHRPNARGAVWLESGDPTLICVAGEAPHLQRRITDFLKKTARADLSAAVAGHADALSVRPRAIRLKDTKSRWGSCSADGILNFSWRLVLAPPPVLDYVAAHEVAHLIEMNHSRRFWKLLEGLIPDSDTPRSWLRANGEALHGYGKE